MRTDLFDFELPEERIALHPGEPARCRAAARGAAGRRRCEDRVVRDLPRAAAPRRCAGVQRHARHSGRARRRAPARRARGAHRRVTLIERLRCRAAGARWRGRQSACRRATACTSGTTSSVCLAGALDATVAARGEDGEVELAFDLAGADLDAAIAGVGQHAAAALHRRAARAGGRRPRATIRRSTPRTMAPSPRRRRGCTSRPS